MKQQTLSIIIPAYNEASTIFRLLEKVHHTRLVHDIRKEIIVVNDCSKDNTEEEILRFTETYPDCTLVYHKQPHNQGKGVTAFSHCSSKSFVSAFCGASDLRISLNAFALS